MAELRVFFAGSKTAGKLCSICQTKIITGEHVVYCPDCGLPFHQECWEENKGCSQYGCKSAPQTIKEDPVQASSTIWGDEKSCPSCRRKIKAQALKCRFCGALFENRDLITTKEYAQREYTGREYIAARNKVIAMFIASATGCLSPISIILLGLLVFNKECMGVDYKRLPSVLKALAICGFVVNSLLLFMLLLLAVFD